MLSYTADLSLEYRGHRFDLAGNSQKLCLEIPGPAAAKDLAVFLALHRPHLEAAADLITGSGVKVEIQVKGLTMFSAAANTLDLPSRLLRFLAR